MSQGETDCRVSDRRISNTLEVKSLEEEDVWTKEYEHLQMREVETNHYDDYECGTKVFGKISYMMDTSHYEGAQG
jgi:hypothetical protein